MRQARQRQSQVCGVHGRGLSGFGQQVHLWPLSIPDPAVRLISPGRRVFRRVTRCHRPWPGCWAPTNPPSRRARPSRSRIAYPRYAPAVGPAGHGCVAEEERNLGTLPSGRLGQQHLTTVTLGGTGRAAELASEAAHVPKARSLSHHDRGRRRAVTAVSRCAYGSTREVRSSASHLRPCTRCRLGGGVEADPRLVGQADDPLGP